MRIPTNQDFLFPSASDTVGTPTVCNICGAPVAFSWGHPNFNWVARDIHIKWHKELEKFIKDQVKEH